MKSYSLFFYSLLLTLLNHLLAPTYLLTPFLALLIIAAFEPDTKRLWTLSLVIGMTLDLLSSELSFGFYTLLYPLATFFISFYRTYFSDFLPSLMLFLALTSLTLGLLEVLGLVVMGQRALHPYTLVWDLICRALLDSLCALLFFFIPSFLYQWAKKSMGGFLFLKRWTKTVKTRTHRKVL